MRQSLSLSRHATAKMLRVSLRTLQNWETGKVRIPYAAYKLVRLFSSYEIFHPIWKDWRIVGDKLITPEGHSLHAGDFHWLSLMARKAESFGKTYRQLRQLQAQAGGSEAPGAPAAFPGLVYSSTSEKLSGQIQQNQGLDWPAKAVQFPVPANPGPAFQASGLTPNLPDGLPARLQSAFVPQQVTAGGVR